MAALHARCFSTAPRPWSADEFTAFMATPACFLLTRLQTDSLAGFLLGRVIADEAELLTLAVAPEARRLGLGRALVTEFAATAYARGAVTAFLEVAAENEPARALYARQGWSGAGLRRHYYGPEQHAFVLHLHLHGRQQDG